MPFFRNNREPVIIDDTQPQVESSGYIDPRQYASSARPKSTRPRDEEEVWTRLERAAETGKAITPQDCFGRPGWLIVQWQIPESVEFMASLNKRNRGFDPVEALGDALVVSGRGDSFEASTVSQFLKDHFGDTTVLKIVQAAIRKKNKRLEFGGMIHSARASDGFFIANFSPDANQQKRETFTRAIRWMSKAVRPNLMAQAGSGVNPPDAAWIQKARAKSSKPLADAIQAEISRRETVIPDEPPSMSRMVDKILSKSMDVQSSTLVTERLSSGTGRCWERLFRSAIIADFDIQHPSGMKGLKVDFTMMCELAGIENIARFLNKSTKQEAYFPVGFLTALGPVAMSQNRIQWHLYESKSWGSGNDLEFTRHKHVDLSRRHVKGLLNKKFECYLGWANEVEILLGTDQLDARRMGWSGLRQKRTKTDVTSTSYSVNMSFKAGINLGGAVSRSYVTNSTLQRFDNKNSNWVKAVSGAIASNAVVYDASTDRAWLVPKLSLILHLAHFYYYQFRDLNGNKPSPVPFAKPSYDGGVAAAKALIDNGDVVLFGFGEADEDKRTLRNVFVDLSLNLSNSPLVGQKVGRRYLYASELAGFATEPDAGLPYTEVSKPAWAILVEFFDAVGVCSQLGTAIRPVVRGQPRVTEGCKCDQLASGEQILGASMVCVADLLKRRNLALPALLQGEVQLVQDVWWRYQPFAPCNHRRPFWTMSNGKPNKSNYQHLTKLRKDYGRLSMDQKKRLFSVEQQAELASSGQPYERGAIIFGKEDGWLVKMVDRMRGDSSQRSDDVDYKNSSGSSQNRSRDSEDRRGGSREESIRTENLPRLDRESDRRRADQRDDPSPSWRYDSRYDTRASSSSQQVSRSRRDEGSGRPDYSRSTSRDASLRSTNSTASYQTAISHATRSEDSRRTQTSDSYRSRQEDSTREMGDDDRQSKQRRGLRGWF